ncbi:MAG: LegC family aminotransferase [Flavobacteriales bacterium]
MFESIVSFIKELYGTEKVPLHEPVFIGNEKKYLEECIDSTFVSSVGKFVDEFEKKLATYTGSKFAVVTSNGTSALHMALVLADVKRSDLVITQALSFIATSNAISYTGAQPLYIDVDEDTLGLSPAALRKFMETECKLVNGICIHTKSGRKISACVPMHTFGHPCRIEEIKDVCEEWKLPLIEDAAESIGSTYNGQHTGTFGRIGTLSFNGNKTITSGGGGALITNSEELAKRAKHLTTQAKIPHAWEYGHDAVGYNYRMPNINAALALAQLEKLDVLIKNKREVSKQYDAFFKKTEISFFTEPAGAFSNYWLNAVMLKDKKERDNFLKVTNENGVMTRPVWNLLVKNEMYSHCINDGLKISQKIENVLVNIPSSPVFK